MESIRDEDVDGAGDDCDDISLPHIRLIRWSPVIDRTRLDEEDKPAVIDRIELPDLQIAISLLHSAIILESHA